MSPLQLYNTRTRAKQTFVPANPSGRVGLFVCGPTVYDLPHLGHAKAYIQFDSSSASYGPAASPSRTCRTSPTWTTKSSAGRASCGWTRPSPRACTSARISTTCRRCATTPWTYTRASDYLDQVISQIERLQQAGAAYATAGGIYFDLTAFPIAGSSRAVPTPTACSLAARSQTGSACARRSSRGCAALSRTARCCGWSPTAHPCPIAKAYAHDAIRARSSTRNWSRSLIPWGVRRGPAAARASARSRMPCRSGRRCGGTGCRCSRGVRRALALRGLVVAVSFGPSRRAKARAMPCLSAAPRHGPGTRAAAAADVHVAASVGLAHHGLSDQAGLRCVHAKRCRRQRRIPSVRQYRRT